jgi:hypothetical protein
MVIMNIDPTEIKQIIDILAAFAAVLNSLGVSGLIALAMSGPVIVLSAVLYVEYKRAQSAQEMVEQMRQDYRAVLETYRKDMTGIQRDFDVKHGEIKRFYNDNVRLVQDYQKVAESLQDVVISNTRTNERLIVLLEERKRNNV